MRWQAVITSDKTTVTNQVLTETQWSGNLVSPRATPSHLTATQVSDPSKVFTLKIAVAPQRYNGVAYKVGQVATFAETQVRFNGTTTTENLAYTIASVSNGRATDHQRRRHHERAGHQLRAGTWIATACRARTPTAM